MIGENGDDRQHWQSVGERWSVGAAGGENFSNE